MLCTEPLPKLCSPSTTARFKSCKQPATISDALALPPFMRMTIGNSGRGLRPDAVNFWMSAICRASVETTSWPRGRNFSDTFTA